MVGVAGGASTTSPVYCHRPMRVGFSWQRDDGRLAHGDTATSGTFQR